MSWEDKFSLTHSNLCKAFYKTRLLQLHFTKQKLKARNEGFEIANQRILKEQTEKKKRGEANMLPPENEERLNLR